jgi:hypothetical protein
MFVFFLLAGALHLFGAAGFAAKASCVSGVLALVFSLIAGAGVMAWPREEPGVVGAIFSVIGGGACLLVASTLSGIWLAVTLVVLVSLMAHVVAENVVGPEPHFASWYLAMPLGTTLGLVFAIVANLWWPMLVLVVVDLALKYAFVRQEDDRLTIS